MDFLPVVKAVASGQYSYLGILPRHVGGGAYGRGLLACSEE